METIRKEAITKLTLRLLDPYIFVSAITVPASFHHTQWGARACNFPCQFKGPGFHFTNRFCAHITNFGIIIIVFLFSYNIQSFHIFVNATIHLLAGHMQSLDRSGLYFSRNSNTQCYKIWIMSSWTACTKGSSLQANLYAVMWHVSL